MLCVGCIMCLCFHRRVSDIDQDNALSQDEFCIAMKLVLMRRKGIEIPTTLPEPLNLLTKRETSSMYILFHR